MNKNIKKYKKNKCIHSMFLQTKAIQNKGGKKLEGVRLFLFINIRNFPCLNF